MIFTLLFCSFFFKDVQTEQTEKLEVQAEIYQTKKEYDKAESIYEDLIVKKPKDEKLQLKLAEVMSWDKKYDESLRIYEKLLNEHPSDMQIRRKYALVLMWSGREKEAAEQLEKTLK